MFEDRTVALTAQRLARRAAMVTTSTRPPGADNGSWLGFAQEIFDLAQQVPGLSGIALARMQAAMAAAPPGSYHLRSGKPLIHAKWEKDIAQSAPMATPFTLQSPTNSYTCQLPIGSNLRCRFIN